MRLTPRPAFAALSFVAVLAVAPFLRAADTPAVPSPKTAVPASLAPNEIRLWQADAPGAVGQKPTDIPTLTAFHPDPAKLNGASMVVMPGGGYANLAAHEGKTYAEWLADHGITAYVLKYRLGPTYHHPTQLNDIARAVRMVRMFAKRDGLDPARVGVIGSSAGGHLASTIATHFASAQTDPADPIDRESSRPDLAVLCYPVITLGEFAHAGSRTMLLGREPAPELVKLLSNELQVKKDTPPCFIWHTVEDKVVPVENALLFAAALRQAGVPVSLHIYEKGAHGLGMKPTAPPWTDQLLFWFGERKFLK